MSEYRSNVDLPQAARLFRQANHVTVTTHAKPDGDGFGAVVALTKALHELGQKVDAWFMSPVPSNLQSLNGCELVKVFENGTTLGETDLVAVLDTGASSQVGPMLEQLRPHAQRTLIIDHHLSGDLPAKWRYIDGQAAACCEIIADLIAELGVELGDSVICDALFVGLAADTGWFRFSNTRPHTHDIAARLLRAGVDHARLHAQLQQSEKLEKLALMIRALDSLELLREARAALMVLRADDFRDCGADISDTEQFVDIPQMVASVQMVVLITEPPATPDEPAPRIRISFRSKPGPDAVNVAYLAARFGGGGHARAAGAKVSGTFDEVVARVRSELT